jgi:hypothetical protein
MLIGVSVLMNHRQQRSLITFARRTEFSASSWVGGERASMIISASD